MSKQAVYQGNGQHPSVPSPDVQCIELEGVSTNNLKAVHVAFPLGAISVVTGVSGSGKSSLVFDTLYGEAYRRYVESLSSFARQYLQALPKPLIDTVRHLPPAIAVRQLQSTASNRSTVGTATELTDLLRVLFTHLAVIQCQACAAPVRKDYPEAVAVRTVAGHHGKKVLICAPLERWTKVAPKELRLQLEGQGFSRLLTARGETQKLAEVKTADFSGAAIVIDRINVGPDSTSRLGESLRLAFKVGRGKLWVVPEGSTREAYSSGLDCPSCGLEYQGPSMALLSFNHPLGACVACQGFGFTSEVDMAKVIPDRSSSLADAGVAAWNFGAFKEYYAWAKASALLREMVFDKPFCDYSVADWAWLRQGSGKSFDGIDGFFAYLASKKYKAHYRIHAARFRLYVPCASCGGKRLNDQALACHVQGLNLAQVCQMAVKDVLAWLAKLQAESIAQAAVNQAASDGLLGVAEAMLEMTARLTYLVKIGVSYLSLDRAARSLSGGELQRINMARCLGSALTDTLFCLDEPSSGLHARDSGNLLAIIRELRDQGNTVVMVEHERRLIAGADHLVEIGPAAGHAGGEVVYAGPAAARLVPQALPLPPVGTEGSRRFRYIEITGARTHNLKDLSVRFPLGAITAVCGVSGSGKTSLVQHTLYPLLAQALGQPQDRNAAAQVGGATVGPIALIKAHAEVVLVSQAGLGRSSRSNIATYLGLMDEMRKLLAAQPLARKLGLKPGAFSFNTPGGRCETCRGLGTVTEDLSFLGEMEVSCPSCHGRRFEDKVLSVEVLGKNLLQMLNMTVAQAREFFYDRPHIVKICDQVIGMGMGYLTLGQGTSSFSGGEAQRLKLVNRVREALPGKPSILIFDEPTTGLSDSDVATLLAQLRLLADQGHMVIVVEHHLDVLRSADWLVEIGPEAAAAGGELVYAGAPAGLIAVSRSLTRPYLWGP